jgi:hypothetical protein
MPRHSRCLVQIAVWSVPSEVDVDIPARLLIRFLALISPFVSTTAGAEELGARLREPGPGVELDVLPYATGGWYGSLWYGFGHLRLRGVVSEVNPPDFTIEGDFTNAQTRAYALIVDYFPRRDRTALWLGAGIERWENSIEHPEEVARGQYDTVMATLGVGWIWRLGDHVYVNPWAAGHLRVAGDDQALLGSRLYAPDRFVPEASVKIGWRF